MNILIQNNVNQNNRPLNPLETYLINCRISVLTILVARKLQLQWTDTLVCTAQKSKSNSKRIKIKLKLKRFGGSIYEVNSPSFKLSEEKFRFRRKVITRDELVALYIQRFNENIRIFDEEYLERGQMN